MIANVDVVAQTPGNLGDPVHLAFTTTISPTLSRRLHPPDTTISLTQVGEIVVDEVKSTPPPRW